MFQKTDKYILRQYFTDIFCNFFEIQTLGPNHPWVDCVELPIYDKHFLLQIPPGELVINRSYKSLLSEKVVSVYKESVYVNGGYLTTDPVLVFGSAPL